jgi:hypothetical protein
MAKILLTGFEAFGNTPKGSGRLDTSSASAGSSRAPGKPRCAEHVRGDCVEGGQMAIKAAIEHPQDIDEPMVSRLQI